MVDFAIYLRPQQCVQETEAAARLQSLRLAAPELSANHTDMEALLQGPITISIETKRENDSVYQADLQMGTWQAAQWKMLTQQAAENSLLELAFLPCLLIYGHDWTFAASSRSGTKTVGLSPVFPAYPLPDNSRLTVWV